MSYMEPLNTEYALCFVLHLRLALNSLHSQRYPQTSGPHASTSYVLRLPWLIYAVTGTELRVSSILSQPSAELQPQHSTGRL